MRIRFYLTSAAGTVVGYGCVEGLDCTVLGIKGNLAVGQSLYTLGDTEDFPAVGLARPLALGTLA